MLYGTLLLIQSILHFIKTYPSSWCYLHERFKFEVMANKEIAKTAEIQALEDCWKRKANIENSERIISMAAGAFIFFRGLSNIFSHPFIALAEVVVGGGLIRRGVTGHCALKESFEKADAAEELV